MSITERGPVRPIVKRAAEQRSEPAGKGPGAFIKVLLGQGEDLPNFHIREFLLEPGARIGGHLHDSIEHGQLVLEGEMTISLAGEEHVVREGDSVYIPPNVEHWYENRGKGRVRFVCVIPAVKDYSTTWTGK